MKKKCIIPPSILSKMQEYVSYKSETGEIRPLVKDDYIVCFNNIEVERSQNFESIQDGSVQYANLDDPTYRVCIENASKHPGYVLVRCIDDYSRSGRSNSDDLPPIGTHQERSKVEMYLDTIPSPDPEPSPEPSTEPSPEPTPVPSPGPTKIKFQIDEEDEDEEDDDMDNLKRILGSNNYITKPSSILGPSARQARVEAEPLPSALKSRLQERRPSGIMPVSFQNRSKKEEDFKRRMQGLQQMYAETIEKSSSTGSDRSEKQSSSTAAKLSFKPQEKGKPVEKSNAKLNEIEDTYGYVTVKKVPLKVMQEKRLSRGSIIPDSCFDSKDVKLVENNETDPYPLDIDDTEKRHYMTSKGMMQYFQNQYPAICEKLEKDNFLDPDATYIQHPDIYSKELIDRKLVTWRFTPSMECGFWPDKGINWLLRPRRVMRDKRTGIPYQWPSKEQIDAVRQLGFNIVPRGFIYPRKAKINPDVDIEWEIKFAKAELFISRNLHHPKFRVYFFALVVYKAFFEPFEGINEDHFRYILYWLVEQSPGDWTEENVGEKLIVLLRKLKEHLTKQKMPHYFLSDCNMFANVASHNLKAAQWTVFRILENPVYHLMHAVHNLNFEKNFYPKLDVKRLNKILTEDNKSLLGKSLGGMMGGDITSEAEAVNPFREIPKEMRNTDGDRYQIKMREERRKHEEKVAEVKEIKNQSNKPIIDLDAELPKFDSDIRKKLILEFFIEHFLKMAEKSNVFRNHGQAMVYMQHSENLLALLSDVGYENNEHQAHLYRLKQNSTGDHIKDYWNISYSHPKLQTSNSFRASDKPTLPLPFLPNDSSPIPGTERNEDSPITPSSSPPRVTVDIHAPAKGPAPNHLSPTPIQPSNESLNQSLPALIIPSSTSKQSAVDKPPLPKMDAKLDLLEEEEEDEEDQVVKEENKLGIDLGSLDEETDDFEVTAM